LFERNAARPLKPASTQKILTSAAALALLRPEFLHETRLWADGAISTPAAPLTGNLYLEGRGAPDMVGEMWWTMARRLADLGLRRVEGNLIGDENLVRRRAAVPPDGRRRRRLLVQRADRRALSCNFNVVTVRLEPSPLFGRPSRSHPRALLVVLPGAQPREDRGAGPPTCASIDPTSRGATSWWSTAPSGAAAARWWSTAPSRSRRCTPLSTFREIAPIRPGIEIGGRSETGVVPAGAHLLYRHESRPLGSAWLRDMNKNSSNFMAEMLVKTLGAQFVEVPGTTALRPLDGAHLAAGPRARP